MVPRAFRSCRGSPGHSTSAYRTCSGPPDRAGAVYGCAEHPSSSGPKQLRAGCGSWPSGGRKRTRSSRPFLVLIRLMYSVVPRMCQRNAAGLRPHRRPGRHGHRRWHHRPTAHRRASHDSLSRRDSLASNSGPHERRTHGARHTRRTPLPDQLTRGQRSNHGASRRPGTWPPGPGHVARLNAPFSPVHTLPPANSAGPRPTCMSSLVIPARPPRYRNECSQRSVQLAAGKGHV
jgi:hypothetical protein